MNIGVPSDHPLADSSSMAGPSGLHSVQINGNPMPAPSFVFMQRQNGEAGEDQSNNRNEQVEHMVNDLLRNFMDIFTGHEFLRMRAQYDNFNPNDFM